VCHLGCGYFITSFQDERAIKLRAFSFPLVSLLASDSLWTLLFLIHCFVKLALGHLKLLFGSSSQFSKSQRSSCFLFLSFRLRLAEISGFHRKFRFWACALFRLLRFGDVTCFFSFPGLWRCFLILFFTDLNECHALVNTVSGADNRLQMR
jgi:hypothetical protein